MYYNAEICENGHVISPTKSNVELFCSTCGAMTIFQCQNCHSPIRGFENDEFSVVPPVYKRPSFCPDCGNPYPWIKSAIDALVELMKEENELSELEQKNLTSSLQNLIAETPKTSLAAIRCKKAFLVVGKFTAEAIRQFVIDFGCEFAKQKLGI